MVKKNIWIGLCALLIVGISFTIVTTYVKSMVDDTPDSSVNVSPNGLQSSLVDWKRPNVPPRVGLQVGHWKNEELPEELATLIGSTGTSGGGTTEVQINYEIAKKVAQQLEQHGIQVDILPATVPEHYWADVFLAIHADGNKNKTVSGFKVAAPWRDYTGKATSLVSYLETEYEQTTQLSKDPTITANMKGYYAFSWWRYEHAIHPMTIPAIIETGFLTNPSDQQMLIHHQELPATGIATGIINFLITEGIVKEAV